MAQSEIIIYIIKLVLKGIAAFLAIALWSKTRDSAWMCLVAGTILSYAEIVYEMLESFGVITKTFLLVWGIPIIKLVFVVIPPLFYILAFTLMLIRHRKY